MNRRSMRALVAPCTISVAFAMAGCGTTYIEPSATEPTGATGEGSADAAPNEIGNEVDPEATVEELLPELREMMRDLDERIIDQREDRAVLERIDALWQVAEPQIRRRDANDVFNFEQAIELARTGVERRRPADASKGYKIIDDVIDAYLAELAIG